MNLLNILNWRDPIVIRNIDYTTEDIQFHLATVATVADCPKCGQASSRQHSHYQRRIADLSWAGKPVTAYLQVQRFFCDFAECPQKTFSLQLASVFRYARQTRRLQYRLLLLVSQLGGRAGARLASLLGMPASRDILLRLFIQQKEVPTTTPKVLGVDDWQSPLWSIKKGTTYATILVDIEKQRPIELLPGREAEILSDWLKKHPGVEIITRDRANSYAEGATKGAPQAMQIADRWHLLKNLGEALKRMLEKHTV